VPAASLQRSPSGRVNKGEKWKAKVVHISWRRAFFLVPVCCFPYKLTYFARGAAIPFFVRSSFHPLFMNAATFKKKKIVSPLKTFLRSYGKATKMKSIT